MVVYMPCYLHMFPIKKTYKPPAERVATLLGFTPAARSPPPSLLVLSVPGRLLSLLTAPSLPPPPPPFSCVPTGLPQCVADQKLGLSAACGVSKTHARPQAVWGW